MRIHCVRDAAGQSYLFIIYSFVNIAAADKGRDDDEIAAVCHHRVWLQLLQG